MVNVRSAGVEPEGELITRLQGGDDQAFASLVERYHPAMVRLAMNFVPSRAVAEEVAQEAWLGLVRGIPRFEGRSSLKTWLFRILVNRARSAGQHERRASRPEPKGQPSLDPSRFGPDGTWARPPADWAADVDDRLAARDTAERLRPMLDRLPDNQRQVVVLHDVEGLSAGEVCDVLQISEANQRVLLHRGRTRLRAMLEAELGTV
jgi:RNA polymerase sigma-70 factor (ECF subfamily)